MHSLFVYGTLRPQQPNAHVMNGLGEAGKPVIFVGICSSAVGVLSWAVRVFSSVIRERLLPVMYSGGVSKSMLALNKSVIKVKESQIKGF
ncbi:hypothetical protein Q8G42_11470, partial [Acinetobacter lwoffii]|nr:hypothetical protein [Acinetobacter lwoffii]MDP1390746.1 hypothetical protein [Acinetobacter lwoffii]MDP1448565.1 hypothetical protein [Acinetobacter lwoffii]